MEINGKTKTGGLIGNPVEHTLSPIIHNTLSEQLGNSFVYVPLLVETGRLKEAVNGAYALNLQGLNITVPYKGEVINYISSVDALAASIGAVNTLVRTETGYMGYNTDMLGLYRALASEGISIQGKSVIILGAGGAARAVAFLCAQKGADKVYLLNRSMEKAATVAEEVNTCFHRKCMIPFSLFEYNKLPEAEYLAIQATSVGLYPEADTAVIEDMDFYRRIHTGYDLIYNPAETKFMKLTKQAGGKAYCGLKMLLYQGVIAYELWNNITVSENQAMVVYQILKEKAGIR